MSVTVAWYAYETWLRANRQRSLFPNVECAKCHRAAAIADTFTTVPVDASGAQAGPGYLHCRTCMLVSDPLAAWQAARAEDLQRRGDNAAPGRYGLPSAAP